MNPVSWLTFSTRMIFYLSSFASGNLTSNKFLTVTLLTHHFHDRNLIILLADKVSVWTARRLLISANTPPFKTSWTGVFCLAHESKHCWWRWRAIARIWYERNSTCCVWFMCYQNKEISWWLWNGRRGIHERKKIPAWDNEKKSDEFKSAVKKSVWKQLIERRQRASDFQVNLRLMSSINNWKQSDDQTFMIRLRQTCPK